MSEKMVFTELKKKMYASYLMDDESVLSIPLLGVVVDNTENPPCLNFVEFERSGNIGKLIPTLPNFLGVWEESEVVDWSEEIKEIQGIGGIPRDTSTNVMEDTFTYAQDMDGNVS